MKKSGYYFLIVAFLLSGRQYSMAQCTLAASTAQTNILCGGTNTGSATVTASAGTLPYRYQWSNGASTSAISNLAAGSYTVSVIDASCILSGVELVTNGNFNSGNTGFSSGYTFCNAPNCLVPEGFYSVGTDPFFYHPSWCSCPDHTSGTGNFMIVNGAGTPGTNVWCQTITVTPNTNYNFSTWVTSQYTVSPALLQFYINGVSLGGIFTAPSVCCAWQQFFATWNSGASTSANICVVNQNNTLSGNDFGLDDISFQSCAPCTVTTVVTITEPTPLGIAAVSTDEFCNRADGTAGVVASGGNGSYTYLWNPGAQNIANITGLTAANYSLTVSDAIGCSHDTIVSVKLIPGPTANAGTDASICSGNMLTLSGAGNGNYLWSPSAGLSCTTCANPVTSVSATYTLTVTDANGCSATDDVNAAVYTSPVASFSVTTACFNNPTSFTDLSSGTIVQWKWDFGDPSSGLNNISALQNPTHTYNAPGSFTATLTEFSPEGCSDTLSLKVAVNPLPVTSFSSTTVCIGSSTVFTDLSAVPGGTVTAWSWNFGDPASGANNTAGIQSPTHIFSAVGVYNVLLTTTSDNACQSSAIKQVTVFAPPVAGFTVTPACLNSMTVFTDVSANALNWNWSFGDGGTSAIQNPTHLYLLPGAYTTTLIVFSSGSCADTIVQTVNVNPLPVVNFITDSVCQGDTTDFFNLSYISAGNITGSHWDFGDGNTSALQNPKHVYAAAGSYTVTLTATSGSGCTGSADLSATVYPLPHADFNFTPEPEAELIDEVYFNDLSTGNPSQWWWNFGDGDTSVLQFPSHLYSDTGAFVVTLVITTSQGCMDTAQRSPEVKDFTFYIPNSFSPNGDGINELFFGKGVGISEFEMSIFDRWGNRIFYCKVNGLPQTLPCMWDGKVQEGISNKVAQEDVYVYKVHITSVFDKYYNYIGNVSIIR